MSEHPLTWVDVFTSKALAGNGLAVVHDADGLDEAKMLRFARETRLSETTFVQSATDPRADYRNRIWMTTRELPFAGHPSLGTAVAVARRRGDAKASYVQETGAGLQPVEVELDGRLARAAMLQEPAAFGAELPAARVMAALGLSEADADPELAPQAVSTGIHHVMAPVRDTAVLAEIRPDGRALAELLEEHDSTVVYAAACSVQTKMARARSFFADAEGTLGEDPATGSAAGPLLAYLHARTGLEELRVEQGIEMGRPSELIVSVEGDRVRVGGEVVVLAEGVVDLG